MPFLLNLHLVKKAIALQRLVSSLLAGLGLGTSGARVSRSNHPDESKGPPFAPLVLANWAKDLDVLNTKRGEIS